MNGIGNRTEIFGEQRILNDQDELQGSVDQLLITAASLMIEEVFQIVTDAGGVCIPAHVDRDSHSILSNLGMIPEDLPVKNIEISRDCDRVTFLGANPGLKRYGVLRSSDAHYLWDISERENYIETERQITDAGDVIELLRSRLAAAGRKTEVRHSDRRDWFCPQSLIQLLYIHRRYDGMSRRRTVDITDQQRKAINDIIDKYKDVQGALIPTLHDVQEYFGYLPIEVQKIVSEGLGIPLAEIYGVVTFYTQFSTQPKGQYTVSVCLGTACYVKGSGKILEKFEEILGIKAGEVTDDGMFGIEACRCVGACGLAPVAMINGEVYGRLVQADVQGICDKYINE